MSMKIRKRPELYTIPAKDMEFGSIYFTAKSTHKEYKSFICKLVSKNENQTITIKYLDPQTNEWRECKVEWEYPVRYYKKENEMKMKTKKEAAKEPKGNISKTKGVTTGKGVFETWGIAFRDHGKSAETVVAFMKSEYPNRKTKWGKWVNGMRQRYNRGALPGVEVPKTPIERYTEKKNG